MHKLIVIDDGNITHKAIFAYMANPDMYPTYVYLRMIIGYLKKLQADLDNTTVLFARDYGSWRKEIDTEYKAQRKAFRESKMPEQWWKDIYQTFNNFTDKLQECLPYHWVKIYKMEADDIASCAVRFIEADEKILISSDEDWMMLCSIPNVKIFSPYKKKFIEIKNPEKVLLKKIKGDKSDNLLTVPKTEKEWEKRKMIVDLINLPSHIDAIIKPELENLPMKNLYLQKIPFKSCRVELEKLYKLGG